MKCVLIENYNPWLFAWPQDDTMLSGEAFGSEAWSDGHVLCAGPPPIPADKTQDFSTVSPRATLPGLRELKPLGVCGSGYTLVLFDKGHAIQAKYFNVIRAKSR